MKGDAMKQVTFYQPRGKLSAALVTDTLGLVLVSFEAAAIKRWTELELLVAYDWAMREHLHASDNPAIKRRPKPSFVVDLGPATR